MSSIQNLQSFNVQRLPQQSSVSGTAKPEGLPPGLEKRIDSVLSTQDLSDDQRTSLKSDLESTIQSAFGSGSFPPDPSQVDSAVKEVFNKYGLDGDKLAAELRPQPGPGGPPPGGRGGGPGGCACAGSDYDSDSTTSLADLIQEFLDKYAADASNSSSTTSSSDSTTTDGTTTSQANDASTNSSSSTTSTHDLAQSLAQYLSTLAFGFDTQA